jgi:hypothetical protein
MLRDRFGTSWMILHARPAGVVIAEIMSLNCDKVA